MDWKALAGKLSGFAPVIGTAIGGPAGGIVGSMVAAALGVEETPEAVAKELKHNPEAYIKLKKLESDERLKLQGYANDKLEAELRDLQHARDSHKHSKMPAIICLSLTALVGIGAYMLFTLPIPAENSSTAYLLFGTLLAKWGDSIAYWVGTTRSSAQKTINALK